MRFGAPPPPPLSRRRCRRPPPPVRRKVFLVFFDWDRDTITPEGMQIIQQAAAAFRAGRRGADPGHRLYRPLGLAGLQPAALRAARQQRRQRSRPASACRAARWPSAAAARTTTAFRPPTVSASRRTAASRSSSRKRSARQIAGAQGPGTFNTAAHCAAVFLCASACSAAAFARGQAGS